MGDKSRVQPAFWPIFNQSKLREHKEALKYPMRKDTWRKLHHRMKSVVHLLTKTAPKWKYGIRSTYDIMSEKLNYTAMISEMKNHPQVSQARVYREGDSEWTRLSQMEIQSEDLNAVRGWYYMPDGFAEEHGQAKCVGPVSYATMMHALCRYVKVSTLGQTQNLKYLGEVMPPVCYCGELINCYCK